MLGAASTLSAPSLTLDTSGAPGAQLFLAQLQATAGAGMLPPGAARVLAARACRTAAKFGDDVPPAAAARLLADLSRTALCFRYLTSYKHIHEEWRTPNVQAAPCRSG